MKLLDLIIKVLPLPILNKIRNLKHQNKRSPIVRNIGKSYGIQRRVLISYVPDFLFIDEWDKQNNTRNVECTEIVNAFLRENCIVDLCDLNRADVINKKYDLVFGFGPAYRKASQLNPSALKVLYLTEKTPSFSLQKENERIEYLYSRHKIKTFSRRTGLYFQQEDINNCDQCIFMSSENYRYLIDNKKNYLISPTGLKNDNITIDNKDFSKTKHSFLWMGSQGAIHKGLDLLFDVFSKHPELELHVLGLNSIDKKTLLSIMPDNAIDHGFVNINSKVFEEVVQKCAFIIFPSCSEAISTAVITAMNHGLIPLVTQETSITLEGFGEYIKDYHIESVEEVVIKKSKQSDDSLYKEMILTRDYAQNNYSIANFSKRINSIVSEIMKELN